MLGRSKEWLAMAGALVVLAALPACGGEQSVASRSAEAFREAQKKGETPGGGGHGHEHGHGEGHGAPASGSEEQEHPAGHDPAHAHGAAEAPAGGGGHEAHGHAAHGHEAHAGGPAPVHPGHGAAQQESHEAHGGSHAGHGMAPPQAPASGAPQHEADHSGHSGHSAPSAAAEESPVVASSPAPVAVPPEQPAKTLQPDALDAPAATSVVDAQRSAEMARGMTGGHGGHGGHGVGRYRHVDAGRGPEAHQEPDQHDHGSEASALYVCPMHPEVTSTTPGTCPKCGMTLVERRKE